MIDFGIGGRSNKEGRIDFEAGLKTKLGLRDIRAGLKFAGGSILRDMRAGIFLGMGGVVGGAGRLRGVKSGGKIS